ncbi:hypothetical protein [Neolewinella litorea]|uniref:Uncharacterized protein n=1 Tax=Neolewinella litorea TaxID=2562452 RepID=A0A4S4NJS0_9BACT|nr:hypothetical protein [Neolewinella litorea]THH40029.1 hypothetical protein E4021_10525 [Neolewinella litorea]
MRYQTCFFFLLVLAFIAACERTDGDDSSDEVKQWLYVRTGSDLGPLNHGDVIRPEGDDLRISNILTGRDTLIQLASVDHLLSVLPNGKVVLDGVAGGPRLLPLENTGVTLDTAFLTRQPFTYEMMGQQYWVSFEPAFTGFPEFTRPGSRDFVNRMVDWAATAPGLEYSEYVLLQNFGQSILLISERQRGQYLNTMGVLIDTVSADVFGGRVFHGSETGYPAEILFHTLPVEPAPYSAEAFVDLVNQGYSRSYLLVKRTGERNLGEDKRLPRRSLIDTGDLGLISASFLEDGSVMFLSDDHIVLQGSYVLDLDKGLLTVTDPDGVSFRVFVDTEDGIQFTLPVSVVELDGGTLVGEDNYLRIEVVE